MRWWPILVAVLAGCTYSENRCQPGVFFVGPSVSVPHIGTNGDHIAVIWHFFDDTQEPQSSYVGALFDPGGGRIAGSEFTIDRSYTPYAIIGGPDRALITGTPRDPNRVSSVFSIHLASGELLPAVEPAFGIRGGIYEGPGFLVATDQGVARLDLDGSLVTEMTLATPVSELVTGPTVTWAIAKKDGTVTGVRIARGGGVLDTSPRAIATDIDVVLTASRGDEMVFAALSREVLTWSVLGANGTVTSTTSMPPNVAGLYGGALVAERDGYLMFLKNNGNSEIGAMRISPAGVPGPYIALSRARQTIQAASLYGRSMAVYERVAQGSLPSAIDAIVVDDGAPPNVPITLETTTGYADEVDCGWWE